MIRSPLFYVGDKYKLMPQLLELFPNDIGCYVEPFYGGGSSQMSVNANKYYVNDINRHIINIHKMLVKYSDKRELFFNKIFRIIKKYRLSCSYINDIVPIELKKKYPKTYYSKYNKEPYEKLKKDYNDSKRKNPLLLYVLLIYGFNHMIRFNSNGMFNLPVGNVDFNKNVFDALNCYFDLQNNRELHYSTLDFEKFLKKIKPDANTFVYLDPPYYISMSEYNKLWNEEEERRLYKTLDTLHKKGIKFGITNLLFHKGKENEIFKEWSRKYNVKTINSNYISFNDNTIKNNSVELYVYNY